MITVLVFGPRDRIVFDAEGMFVDAVIVDGVAAEFTLVDEELTIRPAVPVILRSRCRSASPTPMAPAAWSRPSG